MNARKSVLSVVLGALVAFAGLPAGTALAGTGIKVPCSGPGGGAAGLVAAITAANAAGGGAISLAPGCTYTLTAAGSSGPLGPNGLPIVRTRITIAGAHSTITRSSSQQFRILEVDGPGGNLSASALTITGGNANQPGGGVFNNAVTLTLNSSAVTGNTTSADAGGILITTPRPKAHPRPRAGASPTAAPPSSGAARWTTTPPRAAPARASSTTAR